ncbi:MAG: thioredoxin family protein [Nitrospirales bacterium]
MGAVVQDVSDSNYEEFRQAPAAVVAYGIASCEPCTEYDPILETIAERFPDVRIGKAKMHVPGKCREIKKQHTFDTYPTTHLFSKGTLLLSREGKIEADELAALINDHLLKG